MVVGVHRPWGFGASGSGFANHGLRESLGEWAGSQVSVFGFKTPETTYVGHYTNAYSAEL